MQKKIFILLMVLFTSSVSWAYPSTPNPEVTPGSLCNEDDEDYVGPRYDEGIAYCERAVSKHQRDLIYDLYQIPEAKRDNYTIDHFIPLALGGNNDPLNLWPEHVDVKSIRRSLELDLYLELKAGMITQEEAIEVIVEAKMNPPLNL